MHAVICEDRLGSTTRTSNPVTQHNMDSTPDQDRRVADLLDQLCHLREQLRLLNLPVEEQDKGDGGRKELLKRVGTASHQLALAAQEPHEAYWDLIRRVRGTDSKSTSLVYADYRTSAR